MILNEINRWELDGHELTSGDGLDVLLNGRWIEGRVEYVHGRGYVFTAPGVCSDLSETITAMIPKPDRPRYAF